MNECLPLVLLSFLPLLSNLCVLVQCSAASKVLLVHLRLKLSSLVQQSQFDLLLSFIFFFFCSFSILIHYRPLNFAICSSVVFLLRLVFNIFLFFLSFSLPHNHFKVFLLLFFPASFLSPLYCIHFISLTSLRFFLLLPLFLIANNSLLPSSFTLICWPT